MIYTAITVVFLGLVVWQVPSPVPFKIFGQTEIMTLLGSLLAISLFLERALEVFIVTLRDPDAAGLDMKIEEQTNLLKTLKEKTCQTSEDPLRKAEDKLMSIKKQRIDYSLETRRISLWTALILGFLISGVGIRTLGILVEPGSLSSLPEYQLTVFHLTDVILTGGLLAGGSDGIHKLTKVYTNYMEMTAKNAKQKRED